MNDAPTIAIAPKLRSRVPYMAEYAGYWHIETNAGRLLEERCRTMNIAQHLDTVARAPGETESVQVRRGYAYEVCDGVATISLDGILMKHEASMDESTSTVMMRNTVRKLIVDETVKAAIVCVDSPGGTVSGAYDLADDIAALAAAKPCYGYGRNLSASAGYLMLSQCTQISAGRTTLIGSIGTYASVMDSYGWYRKNGIKVHRIGSGGMKGAGLPGTKVTDEQLKEWQREVDGLNSAFIDAVAKGRKLERAAVTKLADGRVHIASDAKDLRLIDHVESYEDLFARVAKAVNGSTARSNQSRIQAVGIVMSAAPDQLIEQTVSDAVEAVAEEAESSPEPTLASVQPEASDESLDEPSQTQPTAAMGDPMSEKNAGESSANQGSPNPTSPTSQAATIDQIKQACPGAPAAFVLSQLEQGATIQAAQSAFIKLQSEQITAANDAAKKAATVQGRPGAARPVRQSAEGSDESAGDSQSGNAVEAFNAAVEKEMARPGLNIDRKKAIGNVMKKQPQLHREYLEAVNKTRKAHALIADKFGDTE